MSLAVVVIILAVSVTVTAWVVGYHQRKAAEAFLKHMAETQVIGQPVELMRSKLETEQAAQALHREYLKSKRLTPEQVISS